MKKGILALGILTLGMQAFGRVSVPNLYECANPGLQVGYAASGFDGKASLTITQNGKTQSFRGEQLKMTHNVMGTLITVAQAYIPDHSTKLFTLVVPTINMAGKPTVGFKTAAIHTTARTSIAGPGLVQGVVNPSTYEGLTCSAKSVQF